MGCNFPLEMSGKNHRTARRRNRNNCFLNLKTCLKTVISFSTVAFPMGIVGTFPLNFTSTSPISRVLLLHERYYRHFTYIRVGALENIPRFPLFPSLSHTDTRTHAHAHVPGAANARAAAVGEQTSCTNTCIIQVEQGSHFFDVSGVAAR
jgi:hypothetical protein